jgi:uncharacterized circularly permuted ATP-grasp superfamily protein/uncharacterized alpha-E superfamily protein
LPGERLTNVDAQAAARRIEHWFAAYQAVKGVTDEFVDAGGAMRPVWRDLLGRFAAIGPDDVEHRFAAAQRRIKDMGVAYRVRGEEQARTWPLVRMPLLIAEAEWEVIAAGVAQRAELLDLILRDVYGEGRLIADGDLPAAAVTGSAEFIRPMCGVAPPGGRWLRFYAADLGRGPDGKWWVLSDRAQSPSGAGYALENRLVLARAFPSLYRDLNVRRLAPFFRDFRAGLAAAAPRSDPRICLLSSGQWSETYSEQVHLARYLGFLLVEGEDLVMSDGKLYVRTIAGLKRADVLWRRLDADWCDPLELNSSSRLGVPGMIEAIRDGSVTVANMLGAGLVEARALMSFMPALCRRLLGDDLLLDNVATWWCGQDEERAHVLGTLDRRAIGGAFLNVAPGFSDRRTVLGPELSGYERERLVAAISERGVDYVGQEIVHLSTTPVWDGDGLSPRPFALRVFAALTPDGWRVMPGGFCRVSQSLDVRAVSMNAGARSADVWVVSEKPIDQATLLPPRDEAHIVRVLGSLPSRAADNLFWFGRYLERAEATLRLVRALCACLAETQTPGFVGRQPIERLRNMLADWGAVEVEPAPDAPPPSPAQIAFAAVTGEDSIGSVLSNVRAANSTAAIVCERLSPDVLQLIARLEQRIVAATDYPASEPETLELAERSLHMLAALSGLMNENFNRVAGWNFLDLGRRIERAINTCRFTRQFADADATLETLDTLLELIDSQITYRTRYLLGAASAPTLDMAMLDPFNPRSVGYQAARIDEHFAALPQLTEDGVLEAPRRMALLLCSELEAADAHSLDAAGILALEQRFMRLADALAARYFAQGASDAPNDTAGVA